MSYNWNRKSTQNKVLTALLYTNLYFKKLQKIIIYIKLGRGLIIGATAGVRAELRVAVILLQIVMVSPGTHPAKNH